MKKSLSVLAFTAAAFLVVPSLAEAQQRVSGNRQARPAQRVVPARTPPSVVRATQPARLAPGAAASAVRQNQQNLIRQGQGGRLLANDGGGIVAGGAGNFRVR